MGLPRGSFAGRGPPSSPMSPWISPPPRLSSSGGYRSPCWVSPSLSRRQESTNLLHVFSDFSPAVLSSGVHRSPCWVSPSLSCRQESTDLLHVTSSLPRCLVVRSPHISSMSLRVSPALLSSGVHRSPSCHPGSPPLSCRQVSTDLFHVTSSLPSFLCCNRLTDLLRASSGLPIALLSSRGTVISSTFVRFAPSLSCSQEFRYLFHVSSGLSPQEANRSPPCLLGSFHRSLVVRGPVTSSTFLRGAPSLSCSRWFRYLLHVSSSLPSYLCCRGPTDLLRASLGLPNALLSLLQRSPPRLLKSPPRSPVVGGSANSPPPPPQRLLESPSR